MERTDGTSDVLYKAEVVTKAEYKRGSVNCIGDVGVNLVRQRVEEG